MSTIEWSFVILSTLGLTIALFKSSGGKSLEELYDEDMDNTTETVAKKYEVPEKYKGYPIVLSGPYGCVKNSEVEGPVYAFLKTFFDDPKRFKLFDASGSLYLPYTYSYRVLDNVTQQRYCLTYQGSEEYVTNNGRSEYYTPAYFKVFLKSGCESLTDKELLVIVHTLKAYYEDREQRLEEIKAVREERSTTRQREELMNIYCEED